MEMRFLVPGKNPPTKIPPEKIPPFKNPPGNNPPGKNPSSIFIGKVAAAIGKNPEQKKSRHEKISPNFEIRDKSIEVSAQ